MSDFTTADEMVRARPKKGESEHTCLQDDPDGRSCLEVICDMAKAACLTAPTRPWDEAKAEIVGIVDHQQGMCRLSGRDGAPARAEEVLMTVRICQSAEDIGDANIIPELDRIRRMVGTPTQTTRGAMY